MPAVLVAAILVANASSRSRPQLTGQVPAAPAAPVTVRLGVDPATVRPGRPIDATVYAVNHTNRTLRLNCSAANSPLLVVNGGRLPPRGLQPPLPCPATALAPGITDLNLSVPAVPAGVYQLRLLPGWLPPGSVLPAPVTVTVP